MTLELAQVVGVHPESHSVDLLTVNGSRPMAGVRAAR